MHSNLMDLGSYRQVFGKEECRWLARTYHANEPRVLRAAEEISPEQFLRLFLTVHGMRPVGRWQSHTYVKVRDSESLMNHFFLIPIPARQRSIDQGTLRIPNIREINGHIWIDDIFTEVILQSIPFTTPFWYFHYNPNRENIPYVSMTLNLSPSCPERCTLCAGAKTGRVNNGLNGVLAPDGIAEGIFQKYPDAKEQLDIVAIVTGCFDSFDTMYSHLKDVKDAVSKRANPSQYRVLEHNICTNEDFEKVVADLGYDVFITLECFDQTKRNLALNGRVGRKGRDSNEFIEMAETYAKFLQRRRDLGRDLVRVTYLTGIDSIKTSEDFFQKLARINDRNHDVTVLPWISIFTAYNNSMRSIRHPDFSFSFLLEMQELCNRYFGRDLMKKNSGGTADGYARGLY